MSTHSALDDRAGVNPPLAQELVARHPAVLSPKQSKIKIHSHPTNKMYSVNRKVFAIGRSLQIK